MKKLLVTFMVVLSALALFSIEPVINVSGSAGFEVLLDESALDVTSSLDFDISFDIPFTSESGKLSAGFTLKPVNLKTETTVIGTTTVLTSVEVDPTISLKYIQFEEDTWLIRYQPGAIVLSDYTINGFTDTEGALKLGLKNYNLSLELADLKAGEVTEHATGTLSFPEGWIVGAKYDLGISEDIEGFVAAAFSNYEGSGNNRFSVEGKLTKSPLPGEETVDLVFALLNDESTPTNAYRVYVDYKYPVKVENASSTVVLTPHAYAKFQEGLTTVFAQEYNSDIDDGDEDISWSDAKKIGAGFDVSSTMDYFTFGLKDTFTYDLMTESSSLSLTPFVEYEKEKLLLGAKVPVDMDFVSPVEYTITPHLYSELRVNKLTLSGDLFYFYENPDADPDANKLAYMAGVSYKVADPLEIGLHLGNEVWDDGAVGANELTDLHWYLYLSASLAF
ncbi:hypothetical protein [Petrotoga sp. 9PWA.NaAc.5.4]|uniref:hypothetical protein n=1 Tax=Petrotoga sp. 9PWA.NaAc.5.4 TaxID=1434328 RepID=UPI000CAC0B75|nr:hypothetical protein [Petrotoga sp. 9PWA.NaAc.5.4]PNR95806.1 hypothetical protein X924_03965 [Petrotoga sp. 9PWA.NaAc.5.4]